MLPFQRLSSAPPNPPLPSLGEEDMLQKPNQMGWPAVSAAATTPRRRCRPSPAVHTAFFTHVPSYFADRTLSSHGLGAGLTAIRAAASPRSAPTGPRPCHRSRYRPHPCKEGMVCAPFTKEGTEVKHGEVTATHLQNGRPGCNWLAWFQSLSLSIGPVSQ